MVMVSAVLFRFPRVSFSSLIRNIGIIAHIDAGKTSVTEKMIFKCGLIRRSGSVDSGDTVMDFLPEERERGITIASAAITLPWRGAKVNLIDTPGHVDFTMEVERSLRVIDGAIVVLDASKGVQAQTLTVWRQADRYNLQRIIFINKMDKVGADLEMVMAQIQTTFKMEPILMNKPVFESNGLLSAVQSTLEDVKEKIAELDDEFLEKYLSEVETSVQDVNAAIRRIIRDQKGIPVLVGSAMQNVGIEALLDSVIEHLPGPEPLTGSLKPLSPFRALAFKVVFDFKIGGYLVYCRVYSGVLTLKKMSSIVNVSKSVQERAVKMFQVMADEFQEIEEAREGEIVILTGLQNTSTGDTLAFDMKASELKGITCSSPVMSVKIEAESASEQAQLDRALEIIQKEDPSAHVIHDQETGETILKGMGELHLEILECRLRNDLKAKFRTGPISIAYREAFCWENGASFQVQHSIDREFLGLKLKGSIKLSISEMKENEAKSLPEIVIQDNISMVLKEALRDGICSALSKGPIAGFPLQKNFQVKVDEVDVASDASARVLGGEAVKLFMKRELVEDDGRFVILEPVVRLEIDLPTEFMGPISSDLFSSRACIEYEETEATKVSALVPLRRMLGYSTWLRSKTGGRAFFTMEPGGFNPVAGDSVSEMRALSLARTTNLHVNEFKRILNDRGAVLNQIDGDDLSAFLSDWTGKYRACSPENDFIVLRPKSTEEVANVLRFCNQERIGIVPQGGNTGLVGGATPYGSQSPYHTKVILSLSRMNKILSIEPGSGQVKVEAGCVLERVDDECRDRAELMVPLDLGAKGTCQIGGVLATNAGGIRFLRYGSLHGNCLGLQVVLADGRVLDDMRGLRKDNTGYDLKQLFIGSEGTLGVITAAAIQAVPRPKSVNVACFQLKSFQSIQGLFEAAKGALGEILSAFEFWDSGCQSALSSHHSPLFVSSSTSSFYVLIETAGSNSEHDEAKLAAFLEQIVASGLVEDGILAQDRSQQSKMWAHREGIPEACSKIPGLVGCGSNGFGLVHKFDISLPFDRYYDLLPMLRDRCKQHKEIECFGFGHVGDGNIHINLVDRARSRESEAFIKGDLSEFIFSWTAENGGSVSAEHGIGQAKLDQLNKSKSPLAIELMRSFKSLLDPNGILNPGKVIL